MIKVSEEDGFVVEYSDVAFKKMAVSLIEFAINEKDYSLEDISVEMIAEDFTGVVENHGVDSNGITLIEDVLNQFKSNVN